MSRPKRERKKVNYTEEQEIGLSAGKDSDDEFIADKKARTDSSNSSPDLPLKSLVKKAAKKMNEKSDKKPERSGDIKISSKSTIANICRPNLSAGEESSETDDSDKEDRNKVKQLSELSKVVNQAQTVSVATSSNDDDQDSTIHEEEERLSQSPPSSPYTAVLKQQIDNEDISEPGLTDLDAKLDNIDNGGISEPVVTDFDAKDDNLDIGDISKPVVTDMDAKDDNLDTGDVSKPVVTDMDAQVDNPCNGEISEPVMTDHNVEVNGAKVDNTDECTEKGKRLDIGGKVEVRQESLEQDDTQNGTKKMPLSTKLAAFKQKRAAMMKEQGSNVTIVSSGSEDLEVVKVVEMKKKKKKRKRERDKEKSRTDDAEDESAQIIREKKELAQHEGKDGDGKSSKARESNITKVAARTNDPKKQCDDSNKGERKEKIKEKGKARSRKESNAAKQTLTQKLSLQKQKLSLADDEASDESDDDWEEVDEVKSKSKGKEKSRKRAAKEEEKRGGSVGEIKDLEVSVEVKNIHAKKPKSSKEEKLYTWARQMFQRVQKETQIQLHKTHLLCLFARALRQNSCCNNETIAGLCLSLIPPMYFERAVLKWDCNFLRKFIQWFQKDVPSVPGLILYMDAASKLMEELKLERIHVFVTMLRTLGFNCRTVFSLQPVLGKLKKSELKDLGETKSSLKDALLDFKSSDASPSKSESNMASGSSKSKEKKSKRKNMAGSTSTAVDGVDTCNIWAEVYMATLKRWICVELRTESMNEPLKCESGATQPLQYVIGIDNNDKVKDVTCRYAAKWLTMNRKLRVDREWWAQTLEPYKPPDDVINSAEDGQLSSELMRKDMPTTVSAFKGHPLYVLQRHLLKYEAIYPEGTVPVGYIGKNANKEPVYPRDCVYTLHTQQTWLKDGRSLIPGEQPYKMVKGRKKPSDRLLDGPEPVQSCYGIWQTEKYVPPPVVDGKVPKNEYGNIELFQPWMLPEGAVHIPLEKVHQIARKLDIDYAPAMMGWDHHGGFNHPIFEGIVVAKENEDKIYDAWNRAEEEREMKELKKRQERVLDNWKKLVKSLIIRAKLSEKYAIEGEEQAETKSKTNSKTKMSDVGGTGIAVERTEGTEGLKTELVTEKQDENDIDARTQTSAYWRPLNKQTGVFDPTTA